MAENNSDNLVIKRATRFSQAALKDLNKLLLQLSSVGYQMKPKNLKMTVKDKNNYLIAIYDGKTIIGTATLITMCDIRGYKGYVSCLVVDEKYRTHKLGKKLMLYIINLAKKLKMGSLELKSEKYRIVANILYKKLGFVLQDANLYKMNL